MMSDFVFAGLKTVSQWRNGPFENGALRMGPRLEEYAAHESQCVLGLHDDLGAIQGWLLGRSRLAVGLPEPQPDVMSLSNHFLGDDPTLEGTPQNSSTDK